MDPYLRKLIDWNHDEGGVSPQTDAMSRWFKREDFKWLPGKSELSRTGLDSLLEGWLPPKPFISPETRVIAIGSCFARHFVLWLAEHGFNKNVAHSPYNALLKNAFAFENVEVIAQQFRWAFGDFDSRNSLWIEKNQHLFEATEERRLLVKGTLEQTDVLVVTLGLSELWYDVVSNEPLWRAIPEKYFDPKRHRFRVNTLADTLASLRKIDELRTTHLPDLKIVFTVSPVRLKATFRPISAFTANSASKAILRAALDEFLRSKWDLVNSKYFYFPSYEMVTEIFKEPFRDDNRHLYKYVPSKILSVFAKYYTTLEFAVGEHATEDHYENEELYATIAHLEERVAELQRVCDERSTVIKELDVAAQERLQLVEKLQHVAAERLELIDRLSAECARLKEN